MEGLNVTISEARILNNDNNSFQHMSQMNKNRLPLRMKNYKPTGWRKLG